MIPSEPSYPTIASAGYFDTAEVQDDDLKSNLMKTLEALKEEINKSLKEIQEIINKQVKEMNKTIQDLKMKMEAIKKTS